MALSRWRLPVSRKYQGLIPQMAVVRILLTVRALGLFAAPGRKAESVRDWSSGYILEPQIGRAWPAPTDGKDAADPAFVIHQVARGHCFSFCFGQE